MATIRELLKSLSQRETASAEQLARDLGVSRPTVSRLLAQAGDEVARSGTTRGRRYARTRRVEGLGVQQPIYEVSESGQVRALGRLVLLDGGGHWVERASGAIQRFVGLPPWAADMAPQGYMGRAFSARHPKLGLPPRIVDWNDDHRLIAICRRGEDCIGNLIAGDESLNRFLAMAPVEVRRDDFPDLVERSLRGEVGSSAGGEHPKFLAYCAGRHVLVKFYGGDDSAASVRWRDLAVAEVTALDHLARAGIDASPGTWFDQGTYRFVEIERCDRSGERGRRGLLSLGAIDDEYFGHRDSWTHAAARMREAGLLSAEDARRITWLDVFGQLTANSDRHFGNLTFFVRDGGYTLAPVYDMLPMTYAPAGARVIERSFVPAAATAQTLPVWHEAAIAAVGFWDDLAGQSAVSPEFRQIAARSKADVERALATTPALIS
jgi:hypothetical protein